MSGDRCGQAKKAAKQGKEQAVDHGGLRSMPPVEGGFESFLARANGWKASAFIAERLKMGGQQFLRDAADCQ